MTRLAAIASTFAAAAILIATFFQWWDIEYDGGMRLRRWAKVVLLAALLIIVASGVALILFPDP